MGPAHKAIFEAVEEIAKPFGARVLFQTGKKHSFVLIEFDDTFRKLTFSNGSKNIRHQMDWARQNARRALRSMGRIPRDSDAGSAEDPEGLHSEGAAARAVGIAQPLSSPSPSNHGA